ncbi:hypothetical protein ABT095_06865 [Kitasatospora sp. NPDC002227]|uniref:hypothetical protein n=1 Tax=Kitasatospora sp. NPDC002227 TaxID=3154773 RepID=UPI0033336A51
MKSVIKRGSLRVAAVGAVAAVALSFAGPATAEGDPTGWAGSNGDDTVFGPDRCAGSTDWFRFRFYYHTGFGGAWVNIGHPVSDLTAVPVFNGARDVYYPVKFCDGTGDGAGQSAANNAASAYNWFEHYAATVYYSKNFTGGWDRVFPHSGYDLTATRNNNRSINFESYN